MHALNAPCPYNKNWPEDGLLELKHVANYVLIDGICVVLDGINYFATDLTFHMWLLKAPTTSDITAFFFFYIFADLRCFFA